MADLAQLILRSEGEWVVFILVFFRLTGLLLAAPFYSSDALPGRAKIAIAFGMAILLFPVVPPGAGTEIGGRLGSTAGLSGLALAVASELGMGLMLGLIGALVFAGVQLAGQLLGMQIGLTIANIIDPVTQTQTSIISHLKLTLAVVIFVGSGLHFAFLELLAGSFEVVPVGAAVYGPGPLGFIAHHVGGGMWELGTRIAVPGMLGLFLVTVAMGLIARTVPEMNIFIIGFALRIFVGFWIIYLSVPLVARALSRAFTGLITDGDRWLGMVGRMIGHA